MSTPTPRTDSEEYPEGEGQSFHVVSADFARTLERELTTERTTLAGVIEIKRGVEAELAEMKRMLSSEKLMYKLANDSAIKHEWAAGELRNELAAEREKLDWVFQNCKVEANDYTTGNRDVYYVHDREDLGAAMKEGK